MGKKVIIILLSIFLIGCKSLSDKAKDIDTLNSNEDGEDNIEDTYIDSLYDIEEVRASVIVGSAAGGKLVKKEQEISITNNTQNIDKEEDIKIGQIIYKVPDTMIVMKNYQITIRISRNKNLSNIDENLSNVIKKSIKTTSKMEVSLVDPSPDKKSFNILPINRPDQIVDSTDYTEWIFQVSPIRSGLNKLNLVVSIIKNGDTKQVVYTDEIFVKSNSPAQIKRWWEVNWEWSMDKIIIPIVLWIFGVWVGRRRKKKK